MELSQPSLNTLVSRVLMQTRRKLLVRSGDARAWEHRPKPVSDPCQGHETPRSHAHLRGDADCVLGCTHSRLDREQRTAGGHRVDGDRSPGISILEYFVSSTWGQQLCVGPFLTLTSERRRSRNPRGLASGETWPLFCKPVLRDCANQVIVATSLRQAQSGFDVRRAGEL